MDLDLKILILLLTPIFFFFSIATADVITNTSLKNDERLLTNKPQLNPLLDEAPKWTPKLTENLDHSYIFVYEDKVNSQLLENMYDFYIDETEIGTNVFITDINDPNLSIIGDSSRGISLLDINNNVIVNSYYGNEQINDYLNTKT